MASKLLKSLRSEVQKKIDLITVDYEPKVCVESICADKEQLKIEIQRKLDKILNKKKC